MDQKQVHSTEISEGGKDSEKAPHSLTDTIADNFIAKIRPLLLDFMDQKQSDSTEMNQEGKDYERPPKSPATITGEKIGEGAMKIQSLFSSACIYRVPQLLRKLNEDAYTPSLIAIGPLHRDDKHLQTPLQHVKLCYANFLFCRLTEGKEDRGNEKLKLVQKCLLKMKELINDAKKCYAEEITLDEEMMLVDGCFILEFLCRFSPNPKEEKKHIKGRDSGNSEPADPLDSIFTRNGVKRDLLLLENQIPFFVLEKLFELTVAQIPERTHNSLTDYVSSYYRNIMRPEDNSKNPCCCCCLPSHLVLDICDSKKKNSEGEEQGARRTNATYYHILHQLHENNLPREQDNLPREPKKKTLRDQQENEILTSKFMPSASNLEHAGIKFVPATGKSRFNVEFSDPKCLYWCCKSAHFKITPLGVYDSTETFLRNLIAFEQCCPSASNQFTSYAYLMDMLVNSEEDVEVLKKAGVVGNYLGASKEFTKLFNKLCTQIAIREFHFADTCQKATEYSKRCGPKNMADLRRKWFASPWKFTALSVGTIAFIISVIQFIRSFLK